MKLQNLFATILTAAIFFNAGESLKSCDGRFALAVQLDGKVILTQNNGAKLWETGTHGKSVYLVLQKNETHLVKDENNQIWASGEGSKFAKTARLKLQNDGNLVVFVNGTNSDPSWESKTGGK